MKAIFKITAEETLYCFLMQLDTIQHRSKFESCSLNRSKKSKQNNKIRLFMALYSKKGFGLATLLYFDLFNAHYQCLKIFAGNYETPCV